MSKENKRLHLYLYLCTEIFWEDTQENLMVVVMGRWTGIQTGRISQIHSYFKKEKKKKAPKGKETN